MSKFMLPTILAQFAREEKAATAVEYGLIVGILAAGLITVVGTSGDRLVAVFDFILSDFQSGMTASSSSN